MAFNAINNATFYTVVSSFLGVVLHFCLSMNWVHSVLLKATSLSDTLEGKYGLSTSVTGAC